jgi:DNA-binding NarL/FixJ family response regulator
MNYPTPISNSQSQFPIPQRTILLVDDHPIIVHYLRRLLEETIGDVRVLEATSGLEALALVRLHAPEVIMLDLSLPDVDGLELIAPLRAGPRVPAIMVLTGRADQATVAGLGRAQVAALLSKGGDVAELVVAFKAVLAGKRYIGPFFAAALAALRVDATGFEKILSQAELRLLPLLGRGWDDVMVGRELGLSRATIKNHRHHLMTKLGLPSSAALVGWITERGFRLFPPRAFSVAAGKPEF